MADTGGAGQTLEVEVGWAGAGWDQGRGSWRRERRDSVRMPYGVLQTGEERHFPQKELGTGSAGARGQVKQWRDVILVQCLCK